MLRTLPPIVEWKFPTLGKRETRFRLILVLPVTTYSSNSLSTRDLVLNCLLLATLVADLPLLTLLRSPFLLNTLSSTTLAMATGSTSLNDSTFAQACGLVVSPLRRVTVLVQCSWLFRLCLRSYLHWVKLVWTFTFLLDLRSW